MAEDARDFTRPGPNRMSFDEAAAKVSDEYSDALTVLGQEPASAAEAMASVMGTISAMDEADRVRRRERHRWMVEHAEHPILRELIEAHGPDDDFTPAVCDTCEPVHYDELMRPLLTPELLWWPCDVWAFINDRMPNPLHLPERGVPPG